MEHGRWHAPYSDMALTPAIAEFIDARSHSTAADIYRELMGTGMPGKDTVAKWQVFYRWQLKNEVLWRRDSDPFVSGAILLSEAQGVSNAMFESGGPGGLRMLALYVSDAISALATRTKEIVMDATFGTNSGGLDLFAVLAEVDGTGVPLVYGFVGRNASNPDNPLPPGSLADILVQFLGALKAKNILPSFEIGRAS